MFPFVFLQLLTSFMQLDVIRCIAYERPIIAASKTVQRISCIIGDVSAITKDPKVESFMYMNEVLLIQFIMSLP
jgi:hypothetical protein